MPVRRGEVANPLTLLLWSPCLPLNEEDKINCPRALESLLKSRCSPNEFGTPETSPLCVAVRARDVESVNDLLAYAADPNLAPEDTDPPLCTAARYHMKEIAVSLALGRADVNRRCRPGQTGDALAERLGLTPLQLAAGHRDLCELLINHGASLEVSS